MTRGHKTTVLIVTLFAVALPATIPGAEAQVIQSFDESRSSCEGSFVAGDGFSVARDLLAGQGYSFGAGIPAITPDALLGADIFVIGPLGGPLSTEEACMLETFVNHGGALLDARNMNFPSVFGVERITFGGRGLANIVNAAEANVAELVAGMASPTPLGANSVLKTGGAITFLEDVDGRGPIGLVFPTTGGRSGRAVIIGDEEIFMNSFGGCDGAPHGLNPNNQQLLLNTFAYLSAAPGLDAGGRAALEACRAPRPILEYRFEESVGSTAHNTGVFVNADGALRGGAAFSADVPPGVASTMSLFLDGNASSHVDVPDTFDYTVLGARASARLNQFTIEAWVKPLALDRQRLIWDDYGNPGVILAINNGVGQFNISTDQHPGLGQSTNSGSPAVGRWQHIAGVYDGRELRLFIDGQDTCAPAATSGGIIDQSTAFPGAPAFIGFTASDGHSFHGWIDDLKIYRTALDRSQLAGGFFAGQPMTPCGGTNHAPTAVDDAATTDEDTAATIAVLTNDTDLDGDTLTASLVSGPAHGVLTQNADGSFTYTPNANFNGQDSFTYTANDGAADSTAATVAITVTPVNDRPVAVNDSYSTNEDVVLSVAAPGVLVNDTDVDGDSLSAALVSGPTNGTVVLNANGSFTYTPNANFNGGDSFSYKAYDGAADSAPAIVFLDITAVNDPPTAVADAAVVERNSRSNFVNVLANDSFAPDSGETLMVSAVTAPANGSAAVAANGSGVVYTPAPGFGGGNDTFTYTVADGNGGFDTASVFVTVRRIAADLAITKSPASGERIVRQPFEYTLVVRNNGPDPAIGVAVNDFLAKGVALNSASATRGSCGVIPIRGSRDTLVNCNIGTLASGESVQIVLNVTPTNVGVVTNRGGVTSQTHDPSPSNNLSNRSQIRVRFPAADVSIVKTASNSSPTVGSTLTYTLIVRNGGPDTAPSVRVTDHLPRQVTFDSATSSQGTCSLLERRFGVLPVVFCDLGSLASGGPATVTLQTVVRARGGIMNQAFVTGGLNDPVPNNDRARALVEAR